MRDLTKKNAYMRTYSAKRRLESPAWVEQNRVAARERARRLAKESAPERVAEQYLREQVTALGGMCPKFIDPARRGAPDRMVLLPGLPVHFVEMKRAKLGRLEAHQERYHADLRRLGHRVWVLWSKEDVRAFIAEVTLT